ncbi:MAG: glycoside hydrolase family 31 protein, partial [Oscillospiraceae bacterium]
ICARAPIYHTDEEAEFWKKAIDLKEEYFVKNAKTQETLLPDTTFYNPADAPEKRQSRYLDITNPAAVSWWFRDVWGRVKETMGIDGCKIDFCEQFPEHILLSFYDGRDTNGAHHWYPVLYNSLMYRYYQSNHLDGGMCFSRGGGIGAQRYPLLWLGDQLREWKFMSAILTGALSCGLSGIPFVSWDLAAYLPSNDPQNNNEADIFQRGLEVACFSTSMQTHGKVTRPYDFAEPVKDVYRKYSKIHQILRPYLKEQAEKSCQSGMPLMRHLLLHDFSDPVNYTIEDEYLLGEALLIAPVLNNQNKRDIYLPQGKWTSLDTGEEYDGKQWLSSVSVPIDEIPIFIKQGHSSLVLDNIVAKIRKLTKGI